MPPKPSHLARAPARAAGATPGPGSAPAPPCGCGSSHCASASALLQWRSMRRASVFTPRSARKLSKGPAIAPTAFCRKPRRSRSGLVARLAADHRDAADHVGVAVEVLGGRVHDDVEAELQRALHIGAGEGVVGHAQDAARRGRCARWRARSASRSSGLVGVSTHTIRVSGRSAASRFVGIGQVDEAEAVAGAARAHALEQPEGAAVQVVAGDDVRAGVEQLEHGRDRGQPGGEGEAPARRLRGRPRSARTPSASGCASGRSRGPCARPGSTARRSRWRRSAA